MNALAISANSITRINARVADNNMYNVFVISVNNIENINNPH